jgi:hypothetical protein
MFEKYTLVTRGFQNVVENGQVLGFQIKIRIPYYRGIYLALINSLEITVDGQKFSPSQLRFSIAGRTFTMDEMAREENARWPFGEPATVTVLKPEGLALGLHEVTLEQAIKPAYMPGRGFTSQITRKLTLVA